jgi:hypothetical protein
VRRLARGTILLNKRKLALMGAFLFTLGIVISANAEPQLGTNIMSDQLQRQDSGLNLALGHSPDQMPFLASSNKGGREFSVSLGRSQGVEHLYGHSDVKTVTNPEPTPMLLLGSGLVGVASIIRKKRRTSR